MEMSDNPDVASQATESREVAIKLLEEALRELRGHRHDFRNFLQNFNILATNDSVANKQTDEMHGTMKMAQGALQAFSSVPNDLRDIKTSLVEKATSRSGIPYPIVMLLLVLFALLVAVPTWLPILVNTNSKFNVSKSGLGIETSQNQREERQNQREQQQNQREVQQEDTPKD
jgi:hypothetical protein